MAEQDFANFLDEVNASRKKFVDDAGRGYEGPHVFRGEEYGLKFPVIMNFRDGYLDSGNGKRPAVEYPGWIEYWENGIRHRSDDLAAVSKEGFKHNEIWVLGKFIKKI